MMLWVDTDFGFDDLWALLMLERAGLALDGVSLVAGNATLPQVTSNALGAVKAYGLTFPLYGGAAKPLVREPETAASVLGPTAIQTRGQLLPIFEKPAPPPTAKPAIQDWLASGGGSTARELLALGPLTNIAQLVLDAPELASSITRLVWMGGSNGPGNHTKAAEFNAYADPEAAKIVAEAGIPMDVIDLAVCRTVTYGEEDLPPAARMIDQLTADLLGGYLDIALRRGRSSMAIYDPLAALAMIAPDQFEFAPVSMSVSVEKDGSYGATHFTPDPASCVRLAVRAPANAKQACLAALTKIDSHKESAHVD